MFYGDVFRALNKARVKYVVAGGTAVVLHGYMRMTQDLDLIVGFEEKNLDRFFEALKRINYHPKAPVTKDQFKDVKHRHMWRKEKGMIVFSFYKNEPPFQLVDMFVYEPLPFGEIYKKRVGVKVSGITIPIMCIDHLRKLKQAAGRPQDLIDIVQLDVIKRTKRCN